MPRLFATLFGLCFTFFVVTAFAQHGEAILEGRLLAPCCWTQTLDIHESPLATELRTEIHGRLDQGESAATIEEDLVARYGERIRAIPKGGHDPRVTVSIASAVAMLLSAIGLLWLLRRWTRPRAALALPHAATHDAYDARLDDELRELDHP